MYTNDPPFEKQHLIFLFFWCLIICQPLVGQDFMLSNDLRLETITSKDGLPSNSANTFLHDQEGYMWIGTFNGLTRYDGHQFKVYQADETGLGLAGNYIMALHEDRHGFIWIGTMFNGIQRFDPKTETFTTYPIGKNNGISWKYVTDIKEDSKGTIWVGTTGGLNAISSPDKRFDPSTISIQQYFPFAYPDTLLQYISKRVSENNVLAKLRGTGNRKKWQQPFHLDQVTPVLISTMGEYGGHQKMADFGWITDEEGTVIWTMDYKKTFNAKSVEPKEDHPNNRQLVALKRLPAGDYVLHYASDQKHTYDNWNLPKIPIPFDNDEAIVPSFSELWGIALIACSKEEETALKSILDLAVATPVISGNIVTSLEMINEEEMWVGTSGGQDRIRMTDNGYLIESLGNKLNKLDGSNIDFVNHIFNQPNKEIQIYGGQYNAVKHHYDLLIESTNSEQLNFQTLFHDERGIHHGQLFEDASAQLWLTSYAQGLYRLDKDVKSPYGYRLTDFLLDNRFARKTFKDKNDVIWIGTWKAGIYKINPSVSQFEFQTLPVNENTFVTDFAKADDGYVYVSTDKEGVFRWDPTTGEIIALHSLVKNQSLPNENIHCIETGPTGAIWIGLESGGLVRYEAESQQLYYYEHNVEDESSLCHNNVHSLFLDQSGYLWAGTLDGLSQYQPKTDDFINYVNPKVNVSYDHVLNMYEDGDGLLWLINGVRGLFNLEKRSWSDNPKNKAVFHQVQQTEQVWKVHEDRSGRFWIGNREGLLQIDKQSGAVIKQDVYEIDVNCIQEDKGGSLWLSSNAGIIKYDPVTGKQLLFDDGNGIYLKGEQYGSGAILPDGKMLVGGMQGFYHFFPESVSSNASAPQVIIKNITFPEAVIAEDSSLLHVDLTKPILLDYDQNNLAIEYLGLHYDVGQQKKYAYRLLGLSNDWIPVGSERVVRLTGLPFGKYTFEVKVLNDVEHLDGVTAQMNLNIRPPWWRTSFAYILYILLFGGFLFALYRFQLNRELEKAEVQRTAALSQMKTDFFSNITHEFRTPLTLIIEPVRQMLKSVEDATQKSHLQLVEKNSNKLLQMVNRLLDLAKIDEQQMKLDMRFANFHNLLQNTYPAFKVLAEKKNIDLNLYFEAQGENFYFDGEKVEQVLYNLLSNAIKFTSENGTVTVEVKMDTGTGIEKKNYVKLLVIDNGIGISEEAQSRIFDRFYQADKAGRMLSTGTGIGLALSKELAILMRGRLEVESTLGKGTTFTLWLPIIKEWEDTKNMEMPSLSMGNKPVEVGHISSEEKVIFSNNGKEDKERILIIEDNEEVRTFIKDFLTPRYEIAEAGNGQLGIDQALELVPDLIISDVMMPEKDGFEVCSELKHNELTSHIPIILLTAKSTLNSKISGLSKGADAYLTKPFHLEELEGHINQLIAMRKVLQKKYSLIPALIKDQKEELTPNVEIDEFLLKLNNIILEHLDKKDLNIAFLAEEILYSRSKLYRKIKALTGQSPNEYVRNFRLDQALKLLRNKTGTVPEIADMVGFTDEKYFSTRFKERFGNSPREINQVKP